MTTTTPAARASSEDWCESTGDEGHSWTYTLHGGKPRVETRRCILCDYLSVAPVRDALDVLRRKLDKARRQRDKARARLADSLESDRVARQILGADDSETTVGTAYRLVAQLRREATARQALTDAIAKIADDAEVAGTGSAVAAELADRLRAALAATTPPDSRKLVGHLGGVAIYSDPDMPENMVGVEPFQQAAARLEHYTPEPIDVWQAEDGTWSYRCHRCSHVSTHWTRYEYAQQANGSHLDMHAAEGHTRPPVADETTDTGQDTTTPDEVAQRIMAKAGYGLPSLAPGTVVRILGPDVPYVVDSLSTAGANATLTLTTVDGLDWAAGRPDLRTTTEAEADTQAAAARRTVADRSPA